MIWILYEMESNGKNAWKSTRTFLNLREAAFDFQQKIAYQMRKNLHIKHDAAVHKYIRLLI